MGWAWSDVQFLQRQQTQTPARQTVSTRRTRHTIQRQTGSMDIDPGCSNTQSNNFPVKDKPTTTQRYNWEQKAEEESYPLQWSSLKTPLLPYLILQSLCNQVRLRQPKYGIINITTRLILAMSRPVTQFSSMAIKYRRCWTGSKEANLNVTPTQLHRRNTKSNCNLLLSKNGCYPCSRAQGWKQQKQSPFQEAKRWTIAAKFAGARSAKSIQKEKKTMMICHNVIRANAPTIGNVWLTWMLSHTLQGKLQKIVKAGIAQPVLT